MRPQAADPRIRYHRMEENRGAARNYNRVFEMSRGRFFSWTAHDDDVHARLRLRAASRDSGVATRRPCSSTPAPTFVDEDGNVIGPDTDVMATDRPSATGRLRDTLWHVNMAQRGLRTHPGRCAPAHPADRSLRRLGLRAADRARHARPDRRGAARCCRGAGFTNESSREANISTARRAALVRSRPAGPHSAPDSVSGSSTAARPGGSPLDAERPVGRWARFRRSCSPARRRVVGGRWKQRLTTRERGDDVRLAQRRPADARRSGLREA